MKNTLISHLEQDIIFQYDDRISHIKQQINQNYNEDEAKIFFSLLEQLSEFELGQFLITHEGLNGYWTHELVTWDSSQPTRVLTNEIETALFEKIPATLATRQRFNIFQNKLQSLLSKDKVVASIPSGYMSEVLLNKSEVLKETKLVGIDLDLHAINGAKKLASQLGLEKNLTLVQEDAWKLLSENEFDIITSNGLNIYEHDNERVKDLYKIFYNSLKENGTLITSFLTPPPTLSEASPWKMDKIDLKFLQLQKTIFVDILKAKWSAYRDVDTTLDQLRSAGFKDIEIIYDDACLFPTVIAKK